jgi:hypothetical protein
LSVLVCARALAYEHETRVGVAVGENELIAALVERAARTVSDFFPNDAESRNAVFGRNVSDRRRGLYGLARWNGFVLL